MKGCLKVSLTFDAVLLDDDPDFTDAVLETLTHALEKGVGRADWIALSPPVITVVPADVLKVINQ